jgi:hypothetical protein
VFKGDTGIVAISVLGVVAIAMLIVLSRFLLRDPTVRRTRFGWFVERDHFDDEPPWPELQPPVERTLPNWRDQPTEEKKPDA